MGISPYAPLYERVFEVERYRRQYAAYLDLLMRQFFNEEQMSAWVQTYHDLIAPYLVQGSGDKMYAGPGAWFTLQQFEDSWRGIPALTRDRSKYLRELLDLGVYRLDAE
jgi:hypothetical protein